MSAAESHAPPTDDWVPAEHRWFGIDKRTIGPSVAVLALVLLWSTVMPAIDRASSYDTPIRDGDVIDLAAGQLIMEPEPRWELASRTRLDRARNPAAPTSTTKLTRGDTEMTVTVGPFTGTSRELFSQIDDINDKLDDARGLGTESKTGIVVNDDGTRGVVKL